MAGTGAPFHRLAPRRTHDSHQHFIAPGLPGLRERIHRRFRGQRARPQKTDPTRRPNDLLVELRAAHIQLREFFAQGLDNAVCVLARDVMELVSRTTDVLDQDQGPSGS